MCLNMSVHDIIIFFSFVIHPAVLKNIKEYNKFSERSTKSIRTLGYRFHD
jgi:hypothetical protein